MNFVEIFITTPELSWSPSKLKQCMIYMLKTVHLDSMYDFLVQPILTLYIIVRAFPLTLYWLQCLTQVTLTRHLRSILQLLRKAQQRRV